MKRRAPRRLLRCCSALALLFLLLPELVPPEYDRPAVPALPPALVSETNKSSSLLGVPNTPACRAYEDGILRYHKKRTGAAANETHPSLTQRGVPPFLHALWGRPLPSDRGYDGRVRTFDNSSYTGCCDTMIELALRSYVALAPPGTQVRLWNMGGWDAEGYLRKIGLSDSAVKAVPFDPDVELAGEERLQEVYSNLTTVVPRSDFVRYVVMRNYGGTYIDLDGVLLKPLPEDGIPRINIDEAVVDLSKPGTPVHQTCDCAEGAPRPTPGSCILCTNMFVNFPPKHFVFIILLNAIAEEKRTCGGNYFFCYGPNWLSTTLRSRGGIENLARKGVVPQALLRNPLGVVARTRTVLVQHFDFDEGDMTCEHGRVRPLCQLFGMPMPIKHSLGERLLKLLSR